jgi:hypothetical protein
MNKEWIAVHIQEALEELRRTLEELSSAEFGYPEFSIAMSHAYHHLNTAWNSRDAAPQTINQAGDVEFYRWRAMPTDLYFGD